MTKKHRQEALAKEAREKVRKPLTEEQWVKDLNARIKVLERALIASEQDYEKLLKK
jgi:hypothetical protein